MTEGTAVRTVTTRTEGEGDDAITYDVRGDLADATPDRPALFLFAAPMDASGLETLASFFPDRPVITYDPRGAGRNPTGTTDITTARHADDLHRVISALDAGPVDAFGTSGGGVNLLALLATHPEDVRRAVVHEPATAALLPDRDRVLAVVDDMKRTYAEQGHGPALASFIQFVMLDGDVPDGYLDGPAPDPAMFGLPVDDDGSRTDPLFRNMPDINTYVPDIDALRALGDRLIIAAGVESGETMPARRTRGRGRGRDPRDRVPEPPRRVHRAARLPERPSRIRPPPARGAGPGLSARRRPGWPRLSSAPARARPSPTRGRSRRAAAPARDADPPARAAG